MSNSDLATFFNNLSDQELSDKVASSDLTEEAIIVALVELKRRNLPFPTPSDAAAPDEAEYLGDMVLLERGFMPTEAQMLVSCLHAAGIHAEAGDTNIVQANALLAIAVGGANIRVHQSDLAEARQVLIAYRRGDFALGDDFDPNQGEDGAARDGSLPSDSV